MISQDVIIQICVDNLGKPPEQLERCSNGYGNYVYIVKYSATNYILRCSPERNAYTETIYWLQALSKIDIPIPQIVSHGQFEGFSYLILTYLEGNDIGDVYLSLSSCEKKLIAKELVSIQKKVSSLSLSPGSNWSWYKFIYELLDRAEARIAQNGFFDIAKVKALRNDICKLAHYFSEIKPIPYLDDISTKNLLIHNGRISGIIDIDEMGFGDSLSYVALTYMALLNLEYDTDYIGYILSEMVLDADAERAFIFYTLIYCVDFMGERGMCFTDKQIEVSPAVINRLNCIYEQLWNKWNRLNL